MRKYEKSPKKLEIKVLQVSTICSMDVDRTHDFGLRGTGLDSHPGPEWHFRKHSHLSNNGHKTYWIV